MESLSRYSRQPRPQLSSAPKTSRSGYEPSDTETEWQESTWGEQSNKNDEVSFEQSDVALQTKNSLAHNRRHLAFDNKVSSPMKAAQRRHSVSPCKPNRKDDNNVPSFLPESDSRRYVSPLSRRATDYGVRGNISPFSKSEALRHVSPCKSTRGGNDLENEDGSENKKHGHRQAYNDTIIMSSKSNYSHRSMSAPRPRLGDQKDQEMRYGSREQRKGGRKASPPLRNRPSRNGEASHDIASSAGQINEMVANAKISRGLGGNVPNMESTESISPGDIFFSRDYVAMSTQKSTFPKNGGFENRFSPKPKIFAETNDTYLQRSKSNGSFMNKIRAISFSRVTQFNTTSSSAISRPSSYMSDASGRTNGSSKRFTANRQKIQSEAWFSCIKKGYCSTSRKSPEKERAFDEASFIAKAFVVASLREFWADKHQPASLNGFICHKQEALLLKQLVSNDLLPHIILEGPPGSGKKALTMALLHEIYGDTAWNISHDLKYFQIQETRPMQAVVPVTSSAHHFELNAYLEPNSQYALIAFIKEINSIHSITPEISSINPKADYKVIVLYDIDKATESIQHLIKWIMDRYADACKFVLCCEDDANILEPVKSRCKLIKVDAPITHEIMEVLIHIAKKEELELPMNFAAKIATKSKQNLRRAVMALEACKAHNYPFVEEQPIPMGWEDILIEIATEILADPSHDRLFSVRGKFQKLLQEFIHPKLILLKLVEEFLKGVETGSKRELYYWHGYYDKRLPMGTTALLKLEEFVAKFMSIHRRNSTSC